MNHYHIFIYYIEYIAAYHWGARSQRLLIRWPPAPALPSFHDEGIIESKPLIGPGFVAASPGTQASDIMPHIGGDFQFGNIQSDLFEYDRR